MADNKIITKINDTDGGSDRIASTFYCTCSTAAGTAQKDATPSDSCVFNNSYLITGVTVFVKFTETNTNGAATLKVGTSSAKPIKCFGTTATGQTETGSWYAGSVVSFTYDGTNWIQNDYKYNTNTTYTLGTSGNNITLSPNLGSMQSVTAPYATNAGNASTVNNKSVNTNVPSNAVFTDQNVFQFNENSDYDYPLIFSARNLEAGSITSTANKSDNIYVNPAKGDMHLKGNVYFGFVTDRGYSRDAGSLNSQFFTVSTPASVEVSNNTDTTLNSFTLTKGVWLVMLSVYFASNSTGGRWIYVTDSSTGSISDSIEVYARTTSPATSGAGTGLHLDFLHTSSGDTTLYFRCKQNSGSKLSVQPRMQFIKLYEEYSENFQ